MQGTILKMHGKQLTSYSEKRVNKVNNELLIDDKTWRTLNEIAEGFNYFSEIGPNLAND